MITWITLAQFQRRDLLKEPCQDTEKFSGALLAEKYLSSVKACHGCVIACGREIEVEREEAKGPEYETLVGFGPNLWIDDPEFSFRMNELCDRYGMDTISVSNTIGLTMRLFDEGVDRC